MPDYRVAYQTFKALVTNTWLLTGLSQIPEDEGGNGSRRRVSPELLAALRLATRRRKPVYAGMPEDDGDEDAVALRIMGML